MAAKLYYFYQRGMAELPRLVCVAAGIEFEEINLTTRSDLLKLLEEGKLLFGQIPLLEIDGHQIVQTRAIVRYVAKKASGSLLGKNDAEEIRVDMIFEAGRDFTLPSLEIGFLPDEEVLPDLQNRVMPKYMPKFEKIAAENGSGYLVGDSFTVADLSVVEGLLVYVEYFGPDILQGFPALQKFFDTVTSLERISSYLKSPLRKKKNDPPCIAKVLEVLGKDRYQR
ncbi:glutathione S-transferase alpha-5 [Aplysia californica]|uniref:Glutathione S-transferase alpha-5 n=1 Tax=Aplysia californica TaxID=6500 RepID=A0ABM1ACW5_APLCA|nr:glutathione S-transferase alpha-5 [Aplysia californica]